jgi:hypothetical protein
MSKPLRFTKAEIVNAAKIAKEHGVAVKLDSDGSLMVFPDIHKGGGVDDEGVTNGSSLQSWREARNAGKARGRPYG